MLLEGISKETSGARAQTTWSAIQTAIGVCIALSAPLLGAFADRSGNRMPWVQSFSVLYVLGAFGLWFMVPDGSGIVVAMLAFAILMIGAEYTTIFTNAMLPGIAPPGQEGRISGNGYALGYAGGLLALIIVLLAFAQGDTGKTLLGTDPAFGLDPDAREGTRFVGPFTALWYIVFMIPFFLLVREPKQPRVALSLSAAWGDVKALLAQLPGRPSLAAFLAGSMLYRDALVALYTFGGTYAKLILGWEITQIGAFGILGAITAAVASYLGGHLDARLGPKPVIVGASVILTAVVIVLAGMTPETLFGVELMQGATASGALALFLGQPFSTADVIFLAVGAVIAGSGVVLQAASRPIIVPHADPARPLPLLLF